MRHSSSEEKGLRIEEAAPEDARTLARISKRAFEHDVYYGAPGPGGPPGYDTDTWQLKMMTAAEYYKILLDGQIVGGLVVRLRGYRYYEVTRIFIEPAFQNQGIGTGAFEFLWSRYPRVERWTLGTPGWNHRTRHFYRKVGFKEIGELSWGGVLFEKAISPAQEEMQPR